MAKLQLHHPSGVLIGKLAVPGSKSESNRLLILRESYAPQLRLLGLSDSGDTQRLSDALAGFRQKASHYDLADAGTAMRFSLAFLAGQKGGPYVLDGSPRMRERPIGPLVEALRHLGAQIRYLGSEGFPPLAVEGGGLSSAELAIDGSQSSQFASALMMLGPSLPQGLSLRFRGFAVSTPYLYLTAHLMRRLGLSVQMSADTVRLAPLAPDFAPPEEIAVEPDWSSASYWFLAALLAQKAEIYLPGFREHSLQGDSFVANLFAPLGVESHFIGSGYRLRKKGPPPREFQANLIHNPDLAPSLAVAMAAQNICGRISGLQTLRIKESDRIAALATELRKTGAEIESGPDYLEIKRGVQKVAGLHFETYQDHRMAMALAPLALLGPISIAEPSVVQKSYGSYWEALDLLKFKLS